MKPGIVFPASFMRIIMKYVTFSFDDGVADDIRMIRILNEHGMKATFNLNSGLMSEKHNWFNSYLNKSIVKIDVKDAKEIYRGHEIAVHTVTHPNLTTIALAGQKAEIQDDIAALSALTDKPIVGMATPMGTWNQNTLTAMRESGIRYCRCDCAETMNFRMPENPLLLQSTCHFKNPEIQELAKKFMQEESDEDMLFYVWGHTYEMVTEQDWETFTAFCDTLCAGKGISFVTNRDALRF